MSRTYHPYAKIPYRTAGILDSSRAIGTTISQALTGTATNITVPTGAKLVEIINTGTESFLLQFKDSTNTGDVSTGNASHTVLGAQVRHFQLDSTSDTTGGPTEISMLSSGGTNIDIYFF